MDLPSTWVYNNYIKHPLSTEKVTIHQFQIYLNFACNISRLLGAPLSAHHPSHHWRKFTVAFGIDIHFHQTRHFSISFSWVVPVVWPVKWKPWEGFYYTNFFSQFNLNPRWDVWAHPHASYAEGFLLRAPFQNQISWKQRKVGGDSLTAFCESVLFTTWNLLDAGLDRPTVE